MRIQPSSLLALVLVFAATTVSAQDTNQTGPFLLHITGQTNTSIDGKSKRSKPVPRGVIWLLILYALGYGSACHAGAAIEGLCYAAGPAPASTTSAAFWFNYSSYTQVDDAPVGFLSWKLPVVINGTDTQVPSTLQLTYQPNSNVASPLFETGDGSSLQVGFDAAGKLFVYNYFDDANFAPGTAPTTGGAAYYSWFLCWEYLTGYYYNAVGWAQTLPPHNPTCQAIDITQEFI